MSADFSAEFRAELLDDFYAECDESLGAIRVSLSTVEQALERGETPADAVEPLYRHMHSLKGNAAIVGLREAEQLAHAAENYLRAVTRRQTLLTAAGLLLLSRATQRLEQVIGAHRAKQSLPPTDDLLQQLEAVVSEAPGTPSSQRLPDSAPHSADAPPAAAEFSPADGPAPSPPSGVPPGHEVWRCTFVPAPSLSAQGLNVDTIRSRLAAAGTILRSAPRIGAGSIAFEFEVAFLGPPSDWASWATAGVKLELLAAADSIAPAESPLPAENSSLFIAPSHIVRVNLDRLDELMRITGELVIHRSRLDGRINRAGRDGLEDLQEVSAALARSLRDLRQAITRVRLVPVAEIFSRMPFAVRDLADEQGKTVRLALEGQHTEIDKYLVERLKEPLLHLIRNALSHGIETPAARVAAGKTAGASILLRAVASGATVVIQIRDDGRGVDPAGIAARARHLGLPVPDELDEPAILQLICSSGFSTRDEADRASGRGVGMAVVQATVSELGGQLSLQTELGQYTQFTLRLPLTLSITDTVIVSAQEQICGVPQSAVREIVQVAESQVRMIQRTEVVPYRDGLLPIVRLRRIFRTEPSSAPKFIVLVFESGRGLGGLAVDQVHGQREVVIRALRDPLVQVPGIAGATELGDGRPVLILDAAKLSLSP